MASSLMCSQTRLIPRSPDCDRNVNSSKWTVLLERLVLENEIFEQTHFWTSAGTFCQEYSIEFIFSKGIFRKVKAEIMHVGEKI